MFMKEPHTALFVAPTGVGKTYLALDLLEKEYKNHFNSIIIICTTLLAIEPGNSLYGWIEKIGNLLAGSKTLFLIDDIIANETLDKRRQPLLDLAISGRHKEHSL